MAVVRTYDEVLTGTVEIEVTLRGTVAEASVGYAKAKVAQALVFAHRPVRRVHVALDHHDSAVERPASVDVVVDVGGLIVYAQAEAPTMREAIDTVERRLRGQLQRLHGRVLGRRRAGDDGTGAVRPSQPRIWRI